MILSDHFPLLVLLSAFLAAFFALLWKEDPAEGRRFFLKAFFGLVGSAVALGFLFEAVLR
ncbi:MAG TPA: hypothetical protein VLJ18_03895 [Thermoanaerobaculia bacterium]|nr:hypothetical protein [Thermoanaerobaculia bacterium]